MKRVEQLIRDLPDVDGARRFLGQLEENHPAKYAKLLKTEGLLSDVLTVVTSGGIIGKVTKVEDQELQVEIADGVRIKVVRSTLSEVRGKGEPAPAGKAKAAS